MSLNDNYTNVILEEIRSQMQAVLEVSNDTRSKIDNIPDRNEFNELKSDVKTIKHAVTDTNKDLKLLERRVMRLEEKNA